MKTNPRTMNGAAVAALGMVGVTLLAAPGLAHRTAAAQGEIPMCSGRSDPNTVVIAHANGRPGAVPKFILNVSTDATGRPTGTLVLDKGGGRIEVTEWCRVWQHIPGQPAGGGGQCEEGDEFHEGSIIAHAVGTTTLKDGTRVVIRTDVRSTDEGLGFRVRCRALSTHDEHDALAPGDEGGCEDEGWVRIPAEGWLPLDQLRVAGSPVSP